MNEPKVFIIILNWNGLQDIIECLESLKKITYQNYNVILIDNASKNNEGQILKEKFGDYIYLIQNDKNYGFAEGNNIGIRHALKNGADYILLLNNDTIVQENFLNELTTTAKKDSKIGQVYPKILVFGTNKIWFAGGRIDWTNNKVIHNNYYNADNNDTNIKETNFASGCCVLIKKEALEKSGFFDKRFFCYFEDVDLSNKIARNGYKILYNPRTVIWHKKTKVLKQISNIELYYGLRNKLLFFSENNNFINKFKLYLELFLFTIPGALFSFTKLKFQDQNFRRHTLLAVYDFFSRKFGYKDLNKSEK